MRLYNAHRLVQLRLSPPKNILRLVPPAEQWRYKVTPDVVKFVENTGLHEDSARLEHFKRVIREPDRYFAFPENVPLAQRQQVYLPEVVIKFFRTPHLPPKYASFWVPLWFNKLDMKDYLKRVYNVDVVHIRSYVERGKNYREVRSGGSGVLFGRWRRTKSRKKMTVQLEEPFVWPDEIEDYSPWEKDVFHRAEADKVMNQDSAKERREKRQKEDHKTIVEMAKRLAQGKEMWRPSWESYPIDKWVAKRPYGSH